MTLLRSTLANIFGSLVATPQPSGSNFSPDHFETVCENCFKTVGETVGCPVCDEHRTFLYGDTNIAKPVGITADNNDAPKLMQTNLCFGQEGLPKEDGSFVRDAKGHTYRFQNGSMRRVLVLKKDGVPVAGTLLKRLSKAEKKQQKRNRQAKGSVTLTELGG